ncbi:MAG: alpha/beta hydrolase [Candidatus Brachytrichaceae bacterium NZ_4S206]|jgi:dienelactone hydrolase
MSRAVRLAIPAVVALALAALAIFNLAQAGRGVVRQAREVDGVPMTLFLPAESQPGTQNSKLPAVLVVHGFSGNRQLMYGFGYTLAKNGYVAALIDFAGHGASLDRLPDSFAGDVQYQKLASNIETALAHLRAQSFVDPERVAILGHSMGASAVSRYGSTHAEVPATIALSLGNFGRQLPDDPARPRNFLIMVGANEFAGFIQGSTAGLTVAYPDGVAGVTYGDFADGTARRLIYAPGVEHISILFSHDVYREMVHWLDQAFALGAPDRPVEVDGRIGWVLLLYLAAAIGFYPLAATLLSGLAADREFVRYVVPGWFVVLSAFVAAIVAPVLLRLGVAPYKWMPLTVGNYVGIYFLIYGLIVGGTYLVLQRRRAPATQLVVAERDEVAAPASLGIVNAASANGALRLALAALALTAYALVTFGLTAHLTWNNFALVGDRAWVAGVLFVCCFAFFLADEWMVARAARRARAGLYAVTKLIVIVGLIASVGVFGAPGFLLLLVPVIAVLFLWHGVYSHWLFGMARRPWIAAVLNAAVFAWVIAATFAVVQY